MSTQKTEAPISRAERILAFTAIGVAAVALLSLAVVVLAPAFGVEFGTPPAWYWDVLFALGYYGILAAFLLVAALLTVRTVSNRRANR